MNRLIKTTFAISSTEIVLMLIALLKNKYLAVTIGPEGFGIYGLLNSFYNFLSIFSGGWLAAGIIKYVSEHSEDKDKLTFIYSFTVILSSILSILIITISVIWKDSIISVFLSKDVNQIYYLLFALSFLGRSLQPIYTNVLQGLQKVRSVVASRIILSVADVITVLILVFLYKVTGYFIAILVSSLISIFIFSKYIDINFKIRINLDLNKDLLYQILSFGGVNFFLTLSNLGVEYLQRGIIIKNINLAAVGIFTAQMALVNYMQLFSRGTGFYFMPQMSKNITAENRNNEIENMMLFNSIIYTITVASVILFSSLLVTLLFSDEFNALIPLIPYFAIGVFFRSIGGVMNTVIFGMAKLKYHAIITISQLVIYLGVSMLLIRNNGLYALGWAYVFSSIVSFIFSYKALKLVNRSYKPINYYHIILFIIIILTLFFRTQELYLKIITIIVVFFICGIVVWKNKKFNLKMII